MFKQTIKTNILSVFITLVVIVSSSLMISQYYFGKKLALEITKKDFTLIANNIVKQLSSSDKQIKNFLKMAKENENFYAPIKFDYKNAILHDFIQLTNIDKSIYSLYYTDDNNSFYELINIKTSDLLYKKYNAPSNTRWIIIVTKNHKTLFSFLDKKKKLILQHTSSESFHLKNKIWYQQALKSDHIITTQLYKFQTIHTDGFTYATTLNNKGFVFAIDFTIDTLNKLLKLQKTDNYTDIFIFDKKGNILASSGDMDRKIDTVLFNSFQQNKINAINFYKKDGKGYFSVFKPLNNGLYLAVRIASRPLFAPYIQSIEYSFLIALLVLMLSIPLIFFITNKIVKPIKELIFENEKIKNREFTKVEKIDTKIVEFIELSNSLVSMSKNIDAYQKSQAELLESIVKLIAEAVDAKSHYTGGHCKRVPEIAQLLMDAANNSQKEPFKNFSLQSEDELKEFSIGAWLHDCGKVTTPEYVVDKATKLETINNRIHEIRTRFEVLWRDAQITYLEEKLQGKEKDALDVLNKKQKQLLADFEFIASVNLGGEFMSQEKIQRVQDIAQQEWTRHFDKKLGLSADELQRYSDKEEKLPIQEKLLSDKVEHIVEREHFNYAQYKIDGFTQEIPHHLYNYGEIYNLCIEKGTLTPEERYKINEHVIMSIKMLEKIPFPQIMKKVPEYAGTHHETLIGTGYPRGLHKEQLSIPARIMAIADIFEALTASDRPYKKAKTLSESLKIMSFMVKDEHIDKELFELFLEKELYMPYAKKHLKPEQIDTINIEEYIS